MVIIPTFQNRSARYAMDIELNGTIFHLRFHWNARENNWYMDIQDQDEINILMGIKLVVNYFLLAQYRAYINLPEGDFIFWDLNQIPEDGGVTFDNFGDRYQLIFFTDDEIESGVLVGI